MAQQARGMTLVNQPTDLFSCIVRQLEDSGQQGDQQLDDIAALRSVCRSLRTAVDFSVTHANFHANAGLAEVRETVRRCKGIETVKVQQIHWEAVNPLADTLAKTLPHLRALDMPFGGVELQDCTKLSGLTRLTLRGMAQPNHGMLADVLPQLTALRSLVLAEDSAPGLSAARVAHLTSLSLLSHLDLGFAQGVAALAPQLPNLRSLALHVSSSNTSSTACPSTHRIVNLLTKVSSMTLLSSLTSLTDLAVRIGDPLDIRRQYAKVVVSLCDPPNGGEEAVCSPLLPQLAHLPLQGVRCLAALRMAAWVLHMCGRFNMDGVPAGLLPYTALRELRLKSVTVTAEGAAQLAPIASCLRVLHLVRCDGALELLLDAAVAAGDISLQRARFHSTTGGELLAALRPAAGTLRALDIADLHMTNDLTQPDASHLAALTRLSSLAYSDSHGAMDPTAAVSQLTQLRSLQIRAPFKCTDVQLGTLSALRGLTSLELAGRHAGVTGSWLAALAAAQVPLRGLRLCDGAVVPGCGVEAAIGRLTRLTSLHLSIARHRTAETAATAPSEQWPPRPSRKDRCAILEPLQLQLLGCSGKKSSGSGGGSGSLAAGRNMGLQDISLECFGQLTDVELAAAAGALPDLRRLEVAGGSSPGDIMFGMRGTGLAAFSACRRLRELSLRNAYDLAALELARQLPKTASLVRVQVTACRLVSSSKAEVDLQSAFCAAHGRRLTVAWSAN